MSSAELFLPCAISGLGLNNLCAPAVEKGPCRLGWDRCCPAAAGPTAPGGCDPTALAGTGGHSVLPWGHGQQGGTGTACPCAPRGLCPAQPNAAAGVRPSGTMMTAMRTSSTAPVAPHGTGTSPPHHAQPWAAGSRGVIQAPPQP